MRESEITPAGDGQPPGRLRVAGYLPSPESSTTGEVATVGDGPAAPRIPVQRSAPLEGEEFIEPADGPSTVLMPRAGSEPVIDLGAPEERDLAESHELLPSLPEDDEPRHRRWWLVAVPVVLMLFIAVIAAAWHLSGTPDDTPGPNPTPPVALPTGIGDPTGPASPGSANIAPGGSAAASGSRRPATSAAPGGGTTFTPGPPVAPTPGPALPVKNSAGRCVESGDGGRVTLDFCASEANQQWQENGGTLTSQGKCLSLDEGDTDSGTRVETAECTGDASQQWQKRSDGTWVNTKSNRCLDTELNSTLPGARLVIADCKGTTSQRWTMG